MRCAECRELVGAWVDGELTTDEAESMRLHVSSCAECSAQHQSVSSLSTRLRAGMERPRAPDVLEARIRSALARPNPLAVAVRPRRIPSTRMIAAGLAIAVLSGGLSYVVGRRNTAAPAIAQQVLASHIRSLMPGHLTDVASTDLHNVKPWFNGRVDMSPAVPRLDSAGFPLIGGRLDYVGGRPVAVVVYGRRQHLINVFSWPSADGVELPATRTSDKGYHLVHWSNRGTEHWVASDLSVGELNQFVDLFTRLRGE